MATNLYQDKWNVPLTKESLSSSFIFKGLLIFFKDYLENRFTNNSGRCLMYKYY